MPNLEGTGVPAPITRSVNCKTKALLQYAAWGRLTETASITVVSDEATVMAMVATKNMHQIDVDSLKVNLSGEYTEEVGYYDNSVAFDLETMDKDSSKAIVDQQDFCDIYVYTKWSDGSKFFLGVDYDGTDAVQKFKQQQTSHAFSKGGDNDTTNIVTVGFKTFRDVLHTSMEPADLPTV